jgi:hypothetical protein
MIDNFGSNCSSARVSFPENTQKIKTVHATSSQGFDKEVNEFLQKGYKIIHTGFVVSENDYGKHFWAVLALTEKTEGSAGK